MTDFDAAIAKLSHAEVVVIPDATRVATRVATCDISSPLITLLQETQIDHDYVRCCCVQEANEEYRSFRCKALNDLIAAINKGTN